MAAANGISMDAAQAAVSKNWSGFHIKRSYTEDFTRQTALALLTYDWLS